MFIKNKRDLVITSSDTGCSLKDSPKDTFFMKTIIKSSRMISCKGMYLYDVEGKVFLYLNDENNT